jgi:hypothetical protein
MKKAILTAIILTSAVGVFAQGTVIFNNAPSAPVFGVDGTTPLAGPNFFAQLIGAPGSAVPESNLLPGFPTTTFRTGAASGFVVPVTVSFGNILPDAPVASLEMVAWDNSTGLYPTWLQASVAWQNGLIAAGHSPEFNLQSIGGSVNTPPQLTGLQSFHLSIPEPTTAALAGLSATMFLIFRRRN